MGRSGSHPTRTRNGWCLRELPQQQLPTFSEQQPIITSFFWSKCCQRDSSAFGIQGGNTDGRLEEWPAADAVPRAPKTSKQKEKNQARKKSSVLLSRNKSSVKFGKPRCSQMIPRWWRIWKMVSDEIETRGPGCKAQFLPSLQDMWKWKIQSWGQ